MDPVTAGYLTATDFGYLMSLSGIVCGLIVVYALISNI